MTMLGKLEKYIFYILLFSIPFQIRKIFWFDGWRFNEWQSIYVYATDILLGALFILWLFNYFYKKNTPKFKVQAHDYILALFIIVSAISIKNSDNYLVSWFQWLKLVEFSILYWYLSSYAFRKFGLFNSFAVLFFSGLLQAGLAIIQLFKQSSLGLKYLGEGIINSDLSGIASFFLPSGEKIIRAYGTTPHPNVLAGFLFLSLGAFYFIYIYSRLHKEHEPFADNWDKFFIVSYVVVLFGFFATFSRTIIFIWFVSFCVRAIVIRVRRHYRLIFGMEIGRRRIKYILLAGFIAIVAFGLIYFDESLARLTISSEDQAVQLRVFYAKEALGFNVNLFGIGLGNFVSHLVKENPLLDFYVYQPVHNIYLLMYSETGILGILTFGSFLFFLLRDFVIKTGIKKSYQLSFLILFCSLLFIGFFDHFLWTVQQGRFVFWISLSLLTYFKNDDIIQL